MELALKKDFVSFPEKEAQLKQLAEDYAGLVVTKETLKDSRVARKNLRDERYAIQNIEKENRDIMNDLKKQNITLASALIDIIRPTEDVIDVDIKRVEAVIAEEKAAAAEAAAELLRQQAKKAGDILNIDTSEFTDVKEFDALVLSLGEQEITEEEFGAYHLIATDNINTAIDIVTELTADFLLKQKEAEEERKRKEEEEKQREKERKELAKLRAAAEKAKEKEKERKRVEKEAEKERERIEKAKAKVIADKEAAQQKEIDDAKAEAKEAQDKLQAIEDQKVEDERLRAELFDARNAYKEHFAKECPFANVKEIREAIEEDVQALKAAKEAAKPKTYDNAIMVSGFEARINDLISDISLVKQSGFPEIATDLEAVVEKLGKLR